MSEAVTDHERVLLRDIAEPTDGAFVDGPFGSNLKSDEYVESGVRLIQLQNIGDGYWKDDNKKYITALKFRSLARHGAVAGDIAIAKMADPVARACIVPPGQEQYVVVADCIRLRVDEARFDPRYIVRAINSHGTRTEAERKSIGSTRIRINLGTLKTIGCLVPPLVQQQGIAEVLDTLDTTIRQTEAIIEKFKQVKLGLLHDLLTRGVDANGELRPPQSQAPHLYKESPLGWIPRDWRLVALSELSTIRSGTTPARSMASRYFTGGSIPWVKTLDLNEGSILSTDEQITDAAVRECSCERLPVGTVLIAMYGGWEQIGRTAMLGVAAATNQAISALDFGAAELEPEFVLRAIQHGRPRWSSVAASTRKDPNITKADVASFQIPLPGDRQEQAHVVEAVRAALRRIESEQLTLAKLRRQRSGLMDDLLTGRVRVAPLLEPST